MTILANTVVGFVALLHIYFLILEMFLWTKPLGLKAFRQTLEKAQASASKKVLFIQALPAALAMVLLLTT